MDWTTTSSLRRVDETDTPIAILEVDAEGDVATAALVDVPVEDSDILIGLSGGTLYYARPTSTDLPETTNFRGTPTELIATASALVQWHGTQPRCERCHSATELESHGQRRRCINCGSLLFFRTDPAVIVAITDDRDRLLLARQRTWAPGRVSVIAGFVEPGESLEQACGREAMEEVGVELTGIRYFASQPWPFPRSLMIGFTARAVDAAALRVDEQEIVEAAFFTRDELTEAVADGRHILPGGASLGRALIEQWLAGES